MAEVIRLNEIFLLFASCNSDEMSLYEEFCHAGLACPAVILEENNTLPDGMISIYDFFLGYIEEEGKSLGKPKFFNEISVPDEWSISAEIGRDDYGKIYDRNEEKGRIHYRKISGQPWIKNFLVDSVDWYDRKGRIRFKDYYNRYGINYARAIYGEQGTELSRTWFYSDGKEAIHKNFITNDIIVNDGELVQIFKTEEDMLRYLLKKCGLDKKRIIYNAPFMPFVFSLGVSSYEKPDVVFWQKNEEEDILKNLQFVLNGEMLRKTKIVVRNKNIYNKLLKMGVHSDQLQKLGRLYDFKKKNQSQPQALICTHTDWVEHLEEFIKALPQAHFHIAAITWMSQKLLAMEQYENVSLYQGALPDIFDGLFQRCDYYFDIHYGDEIVSSIKQAFLHNQLIFAFEETVHNREYTAVEHIYPVSEFPKMLLDIKNILGNEEMTEKHLRLQLESGMAEEKEAYFNLIL